MSAEAETPPPEPVFGAPWHAQVFALTVHLHTRGAFSWTDWAQMLGAVLAEHGLNKELDGGDDYFLAWVSALEQICARQGLADAATLQTLKAQWAAAYRDTPHGAPVHL
ncbi:nitrile hydratase accessory protein [Cognatishimia sp. F0-27]|uniref:nitrile hydratase accessory protein n=1 Tax=Cognatishimia sp. F0-27 TaxID=2816855 RepID=UPI001D0C2993